MPYGIEDSTYEKYSCPGGPAYPIEGAVYAPFAKIQWGDYVLTTGNDSFLVAGKKKNTATITSFEFGLSPGDKGYGVDVEVFDAAGRNYKEIIASLNNTMKKTNDEFELVSFDWGWIIRDTDNETRVVSASQLNNTKFGGIFLGLDTEFSGGNVKIKFRLRAPQAREIEASHTGTNGSDSDPMALADALVKLFTQQEGGGPFNAVKFKLADETEVANGEGFFENQGPNRRGPETRWSLKQNNAFFIANTWLSGQRTTNQLGILILHDYKNNEIIIHEDPGFNCCSNHVGTFIVNGGNNSPVISFNPSINFPKGFIPTGGGVSGGASSADQDKILESPPAVKEDAGTQTTISVHEDFQDTVDSDQHAVQANNAQKANADAANNNGLSIGGGKPGWTAELKIMGDPTFATVLPVSTTTNQDPNAQPSNIKKPGLFGASLSIIFINPFYIGNEWDDDSIAPLQWLQDSAVNDIISNKNYLILGVSHQIQSGSYTTTFKLKLLLPNIELPANSTFGGCGTVRPGSSSGLGQAEAGEYTKSN